MPARLRPTSIIIMPFSADDDLFSHHLRYPDYVYAPVVDKSVTGGSIKRVKGSKAYQKAEAAAQRKALAAEGRAERAAVAQAKRVESQRLVQRRALEEEMAALETKAEDPGSQQVVMEEEMQAEEENAPAPQTPQLAQNKGKQAPKPKKKKAAKRKIDSDSESYESEKSSRHGKSDDDYVE